MGETINLSGLDKAAVLAALYNASRPQGMGFMHYDPAPMSVEQARLLLTETTDFDYLQGRVMKINLSGDELDPWGYDRDNGEGAARMAIESINAFGSDTNSPVIQAVHEGGKREAAVLTRQMMGQESKVSQMGGMPIFDLGLADVADELGPKVDKAIGK